MKTVLEMCFSFSTGTLFTVPTLKEMSDTIAVFLGSTMDNGTFLQTGESHRQYEKPKKYGRIAN